MAGNNGMRAISEYPDIDFIDGYTMEKLEADMIAWFKEKRKEITGDDITLAKADDRRILLQAGAYFIFHGYMFSDDAGKMGLLKYSRGASLDNLGALKHIYRMKASGATTKIGFSMKTPRELITSIPQGTRMTAGDGIYFSTDEYIEIPAGRTYAEVSATCTTAGKRGNDYEIGEINTIVDPVPYIDSAKNVTKPENGSDLEDDDSLKERIFVAPAAYSTTGTKDAYEYYVRKFNPEISDVSITSPAPCIVRIRYLLKDGEIPGTESRAGLLEYLSSPDIKPLTDQVEVLAPNQVEYVLELTYYINKSDRNRAGTIQAGVAKAIDAYCAWQRAAMGRDINPDVLVKNIMDAGAKRVVITSPAFETVGEDYVAALKGEAKITYGGLEDD